MSDEHVHKWLEPEGLFVVIDTYPPEYPYECACGAFTHHPKTGSPCAICHPSDPRLRARSQEKPRA